MKIELGKKYRTRDGDVVTVTQNTVSLIYPFEGSNGESYTPGGFKWQFSESGHDLIEEVEDKLTGPITAQKLVFDISGTPELGRKIASRLAELGFRGNRGYLERARNVSTNWSGESVHFGGCEWNDSIFDGFRKTTLEDLYDLDSWLEEPPVEEAPVKKLAGALVDQKLVFDTAGNLELADAIMERLVELGCPRARDEGSKNVAVLNFSKGANICSMSCLYEWQDWGHRLTTLEELYDLDSWLEQPKEEPAKDYTGRYFVGDNPDLYLAILKRLFALGCRWPSGSTNYAEHNAQPVIFVKGTSVTHCSDADYMSNSGHPGANEPRTLTDLY